MLIPHTPRLTVGRHGFLARSTALSWPWNQDRLHAAPGTLPPTFADLALGLADCRKPVIRVWCKDPMQREETRTDDHPVAPASPVVPAQAGTQGPPPDDGVTALDSRVREDDGESSPTAAAAQNPVHRERTGPLRNGNPRGNPNLAPRCGARTRRTGCPCRAPAMRNGRCRLHGGKSTGPRTEAGRARIRAARTRHGLYTAESRAFQRDITTLLRSNRQLLALARQPGAVDVEALRHLLPPQFGKHLMQPEIPPAARSAAPKAASKHPMHRENREDATSAGAICVHPRASVVELLPTAIAPQNPMQRENEAMPLPHSPPAAGTAAPAATPPAAPIPRPILLARPKPHAP